MKGSENVHYKDDWKFCEITKSSENACQIQIMNLLYSRFGPTIIIVHVIYEWSYFCPQLRGGSRRKTCTKSLGMTIGPNLLLSIESISRELPPKTIRSLNSKNSWSYSCLMLGVWAKRLQSRHFCMVFKEGILVRILWPPTSNSCNFTSFCIWGCGFFWW